jgi:glycosyltransferase involved in cell wall biosynthesis
LTVEDITNLLYLADFEVIQQWQEIIWPFSTPFLDLFFNHFLVKLWPFNHLALTNLIVARLQQQKEPLSQKPLVSVVIPARNEAGNIPQIFKRTPKLGRGTELIFVEGHSKDDTYAVIAQESAKHPEYQCKLLKQTGIGKGDAVKLGFAHAEGEILMILDADLTVPPEDLPRFYNALLTGKGDFINGVRLVYPMEKRAMRFLNLVGNKFFSLAFSWLLGQSIKDTLCGTKALWKKDYALIAANRAYFGDFDPFGDFDLLFGAAKLNLKIVDLPIRYRERAYGETNIHRWKHGWLLLKMALFAARRIKFV